MESLRTENEIKYQRWLLSTIYPAMNEKHREVSREMLITLSERDSVDYFCNGKIIAQAVEEASPWHGEFRDNFLKSLPLSAPQEFRLELINAWISPSHVNRFVQYEIPESLSVAIEKYARKNPEKNPPVLASIGYGCGNLEYRLLDEGKVSHVLGLEFTSGEEDEQNLKNYLDFCSQSWNIVKQRDGDYPIGELLKWGLGRYLGAGSAYANLFTLQQTCRYLFSMLDIAPDPTIVDITRIVDCYKVRMDALSGSVRDHPLFEKKVINGAFSNRLNVYQEIAARTKVADIVLFKDCLHHATICAKYVEHAYGALRNGKSMIIIEPFMFSDTSLPNLMLKTAFETTLHPESLMTLREHELLINLILLSGASVAYKDVHPGAANFLMNYDPFHRYEICLVKNKKAIEGILFQEREELVEKEMENMIKSVLEQVRNGNLALRGTKFEEDMQALIMNKLHLQYTCRRYSLKEKTYLQLAGDDTMTGRMFFSGKMI